MASVTEESAVDTGPVGAEIEDERRGRALAGEPPFKERPVPDRFRAAVKDAIIAALIAFALAGPMVGLRTETAIGGLSLSQHWLPVAAIVGIVFVGRLLLNLFVWGHQGGGVTAITATATQRLSTSVNLANWKNPGLMVAIAFTLVMGKIEGVPIFTPQ